MDLIGKLIFSIVVGVMIEMFEGLFGFVVIVCIMLNILVLFGLGVMGLYVNEYMIVV